MSRTVLRIRAIVFMALVCVCVLSGADGAMFFVPLWTGSIWLFFRSFEEVQVAPEKPVVQNIVQLPHAAMRAELAGLLKEQAVAPLRAA